MSVQTSYDEKRNELRKMLSDCLDKARDMLNEDTWGYEEMREDYAIDLYKAIKRIRDIV